MEMIISISAGIVSIAAFFFTILVTYRGEKRVKKQATLDALNILQEQVFDNLNNYTYSEIIEITAKWSEAINKKKKNVENNPADKVAAGFEEYNQEYTSYIEKYRTLSGYLARIEHFSLGVNTGIYDVKTTERAATVYFVMLKDKLEPLLSVKNGHGINYENPKYTIYSEFTHLVEKIKKIEKARKDY